MTDREKVIKGLECCESDYYCPGYICPYHNKRHCIEELTYDALELIKAQAPRLITIDEFRRYGGETMWFETKNGELRQLTMEGIAFALLEAEINRWQGYGSYWRCWSAKPTEEQMKAVKWDG